MSSREGVGVQIVVLGSVGARVDGVYVELGARLRRLLAALVVADGSVVSADRLVDVVWAGDPPAGADKTLRSYVTRLRQALGSGRDALITFRQPGYALELQPGELDSTSFDEELDQALAHLRTADAPTAAGLLTSAIGRWRGRAYAGFAEEDWARPEAVRLEERLVEAREALVEARLAIGSADQAVAEAQALVEAEPLRERPRGLLMRALYAAGRQAEALRVAGAYRQYLAEETGLDPSEDIAELEGRIARGEQGTGASTQALRGYELGERIGEGAFAVVHRAVQPGIDREVAVKIIRAELADRPEFIRRFEVEAQTVARLEHPNVVPLYDFWREPGAAYLVMRWLRGGSVEQALRSRGAFSREQTLRLVDDVAGALATAHRAGVVHRDVRPANLLLDTDGTSYLADFGIALPTATTDDLPIVSPAYAAPEVLRGEPAGVAADVLSLGVTVFELLTGRLPFADSLERADVIRRQLSEPLPPVRATRTDLPAGVDEVLAKATAKAADDRYANVAAFVDDLGSALSVDAARPVGRRTVAVAGGVVENPYVGLHAFDEPDAGRFFGREPLVAELVDTLEQRPMVVVVGPSGSGKSSVVRAGLLPAIRRGAVPGSDEWFVTTMVPGTDPIDALETALLRVAVNPPATLREQLADPGGLLRAIRRVLPDDRSRILLVVDQFEELFTQVLDPDERDRFLTELAAAITHPSSPLRVVATLRADHYDAPLRHQAMADLVTDGTVTVRPLTADELERAIALPAAAVGVELEPALAAELVAGVSTRPSALPLLQFSLTELFDRRVSDTMLLSTHQELGGLTGALTARAERILDTGDPVDETEVRRIFGRLVTLGEGVEDTRRRALRSEFGDGERTAWLLDAYIIARLISTDRDPATRQPTIEVAHEALLRDWPRLRRWLDEDRDDLRALHGIGVAADAWTTADRDPGELARGGRLETATNLAARHPDWLNDTETEWLTASADAANAEAAAQAEAIERDRRQNRRLRGLLTAAVILLVVALGAGAGALILRNRAVDSENVARAAQEDADIERLAALSASEIATAPDRAILLALEANRRSDDIATQTALHRAITAEPRIVAIHPDPFGDATLTRISDDGTVGVTAAFTIGQVRWFDGESGEFDEFVFEAPTGVDVVAISGDGSVTALALVDGTVLFVDRAGNEVGNSVQPGGPILRLALDVDGDTALVLSEFGAAVSVVDVPSGETVSTYDPDPDDIFVAFWGELTPDGQTAVLAIDEEFFNPTVIDAVDVVEASTGALLARHETSAGFITALAVSDSLVVTGHDTGTIEIRPLEEGAEPIAFSPHASQIDDIAVASDGTILSAADGEVRLFSREGRSLGLPLPVSAEVVSMAGSGRRLVIARRSEGHVVVDTRFGPLVDAERPVETLAQVSPDLPYHDMPNADFTSISLVDLETGTVVREVDVSQIHPAGLRGAPFYSIDGEWMMTTDPSTATVAVTEILGDRQYALDVSPIYAELYDSDALDARMALRPDAGGDRMFMLLGGPDGGASAVWVDSASGEIVAGPLVLPFIGPVRILYDGRVVIGGEEAAITILPADLASEPVVVPGTEGLEPLDQDSESGLVLLGGFGGRLGLLDPDAANVEYIEGASGAIFIGAFSPDGDRIAVLSFDTGVQLFDVQTREPIGVPMALGIFNEQGGPGIRWSEDGTGVWVVPPGGPARFAADPSRWREIACEIVNRELTLDEWRAFVSPTSEPIPACGDE